MKALRTKQEIRLILNDLGTKNLKLITRPVKVGIRYTEVSNLLFHLDIVSPGNIEENKLVVMFNITGKLNRIMKSPLGPSFANIFLCFHETLWLQNCPSDFKPALYRRYIDDTFLLFRDRFHIPKFLDYINSRHDSIQFTCDVENNNQLSFLDICISRRNNTFETYIILMTESS